MYEIQKGFNKIRPIIYIKQRLATFEAQFIKKLSNTEAELKKGVAYKKSM